MKITWFGHSCFKVQSEHGILVFDPFENGYVPGYKDLPCDLEADEVICSHGHGDHSASHLVKLTGKKHTYKITSIPTYHDEEKGALRGKNNITLVEFDGMKLVHMGDIGCPLTDKEAEILNGADIVMIPVGGYYTIDAEGAYRMVNKINAKMVIPMHFRGKDFGFDEIASIDDFTVLFDNVRFLETNALTLGKNDLKEHSTVVFNKP